MARAPMSEEQVLDFIYQSILHRGEVPGIENISKAQAFEVIRRANQFNTDAYDLDKITEEFEKLAQDVVPQEVTETEPVKTKTRRRIQKQTPKQAPVMTSVDYFKSLQVPNLGEKPAKPTHSVTFNLGDAGTLTSWYHWLVDTEDVFILVYDLRFEYGTMFVPPLQGPNHLLRLSIRPANITVDCVGAGAIFEFGAFQFIVLVKLPVETKEQPNDDDQNWGN